MAASVLNFRMISSNKGVRWITLGWLGFITENLVLSHNRETIINQFGETNYHRTYNSLSLLACSSIGYGFYKYGRRSTLTPQTPLMPLRYWNINSLPFKSIALTLHMIGFIGLSQIFPKFQIPVTFERGNNNNNNSNNIANNSIGYNNSENGKFPEISEQLQMQNENANNKKISFKAQCPIDFKYEKASNNRNENEIYGMQRVSRHNNLWNLGICALGSAFRTNMIPSVIMFTMPIVFSMIGSVHKDYRYRRGNGGMLTQEMEATTSNIPYLALIQGNQSWSELKDEMKPVNAGVACLLALYINVLM